MVVLRLFIAFGETFFQILALISAIFFSTDGAARIIIFTVIFSYHLMPRHNLNPLQ